MTDEPFIDAIIAAPDDEAPWRIFSDRLKDQDRWTWETVLKLVLAYPDADPFRLLAALWCEESGQGDRAEFICVQVGMAALESHERRHGLDERTEATSWRRREDLRRRDREFLGANFGAWTDGLPESLVTRQCPSCEDQAADWETNVVECRRCDCTGLVPDEDKVEFRRGFVHAVTLSAEDCLRHLDAVLAQQPVQEVTLTTWPEWEFNDPSMELISLRSRGRWHKNEDILELPLALLQAEWPSVKEWHLPREEGARAVTNWAGGPRNAEAIAREIAEHIGIRGDTGWERIDGPAEDRPILNAVCECQHQPIWDFRTAPDNVIPSLRITDLSRHRYVMNGGDHVFYVGQCRECHRVLWTELEPAMAR